LATVRLRISDERTTRSMSDVGNGRAGRADGPDGRAPGAVGRRERKDVTNEEFVRQAYVVAEIKDIPAGGLLQPGRRVRRRVGRHDLAE
jgi:hypothetical protein